MTVGVESLPEDVFRLSALTPPPRASPRQNGNAFLPHQAHQHHFGWQPPNGLPTSTAQYGSGWSETRLATGTRAVLRTHSRLADTRTTWGFLRSEQQSPRAKLAADLNQEPTSPRRELDGSAHSLGSGRSLGSARSARSAAPSPRLQLISWPGHSHFVRCAPSTPRPPPIDCSALRKGDFPLMQRHMMSQHHAGPVPHARRGIMGLPGGGSSSSAYPSYW